VGKKKSYRRGRKGPRVLMWKRSSSLPKECGFASVKSCMNFWILPETLGYGFGSGKCSSPFPRRKVSGIPLLRVFHKTKSSDGNRMNTRTLNVLLTSEVEAWGTLRDGGKCFRESWEEGWEGEGEILWQGFWLVADVLPQVAYWTEFFRIGPLWFMPLFRSEWRKQTFIPCVNFHTSGLLFSCQV
jgi:hypothetical protein